MTCQRERRKRNGMNKQAEAKIPNVKQIMAGEINTTIMGSVIIARIQLYENNMLLAFGYDNV